MARLEKAKESKNFKDRVTSYVPQVFAPSGTFRPTEQQVDEGFLNFLNPLFVKAVNDWYAASKIQPAVEKYENFDQPGYSPDIEPFWDEHLKDMFRKAMKEYQEQEKNRKR